MITNTNTNNLKMRDVNINYYIDRNKLREKFLVSTDDWETTYCSVPELVENLRVISILSVPVPVIPKEVVTKAEIFRGDEVAWGEGVEICLLQIPEKEGFTLMWLGNDEFFMSPQAYDPEFKLFLNELILTSSTLRTPTYPRPQGPITNQTCYPPITMP